MDASGRIVGAAPGHGISMTEVDGGIAVQLCPYDTTPNPGCEYKAWLTPVEDYDPDAPNAVFGFQHDRSKTDNFKVKCATIGGGGEGE